MLRLFAVLWLFLINDSKSNNYYKHRVHLGRDVNEGKYPYVVVLVFYQNVNNYYQRMCTGSMISETWGITAAHCLVVPLDVLLKYDNFTELQLDKDCYVPVIERFVHPSYRGAINNYVVNNVNNDIGVFRSKSVPKKPYAILLSTDYSTLIGLPVVYVGAGMTKWNFDDNDWIRPLQLGEATIVTCDKEMRKVSKIMICLAPKCSNRLERPWSGDSGGPLIYDGKIIGVLSIFMPSTVMASSGYVPVSPYIDWIHHVINVTGA